MKRYNKKTFVFFTHQKQIMSANSSHFENYFQLKLLLRFKTCPFTFHRLQLKLFPSVSNLHIYCLLLSIDFLIVNLSFSQAILH